MTDRSKVQQSRVDGLDTALSGKQATLVSGENIKTINNNSILGSGNLTLDGLPSQSGQSGKFLTTDGTDASWASVSVTPDNTSISNNSSNALQSIGNINKNTATGAVAVKYDWVGTLQEYTTQGVKTAHPEWICYIIDDISGGTSVYTKAEVDALILAANPTGTIIPYAGSTAPSGFLLCDGSAVSRTTYSALFAVIGTTYGEGDGNSTFNLPDLTDRVLQGAGLRGVIGTELNESLPNIAGYAVSSDRLSSDLIPYDSSGTLIGYPSSSTSRAQSTVRRGVFSASNVNSTYQDNAPVQQDALCIVYIIKI